VAIDDLGQISIHNSGRTAISVIANKLPGRIHAIRMIDNENGWAVGSRGTILQTNDGGQSWFCPHFVAHETTLQHFDFKSLSIAGNCVWIVGDPGTRIVRIDVDRSTLTMHETPIAMPLSKVFFVSEARGWAVGALGTILATEDGGLSWRAQRMAHSRIAILGVASHPHEFPLELFAHYSLEENVLCGAAMVGPHSPTVVDNVRAAATRIGCSTLLSRADGTLPSESPNSINNLDATDIMADLVRYIRTTKPNVVVCHASQSATGDNSRLVDFCRKAIQAAADKQQFPKQLEEAGLKPWQVGRLLHSAAYANQSISIDDKTFLPTNGRLLEDAVAVSRALLGLPLQKVSGAAYQSDNFSSSTNAERDAFAGLRQMGDGVPHRKGENAVGNLGAIRQATSKQAKFNQLLNCNLHTAEDQLLWKRQLLDMQLGLEPCDIEVWMLQLANAYYRSGKFEQAARTIEMMLNQVDNGAFTIAGTLWLARYYASTEFTTIAIRQSAQDHSRSVESDRPETETVPGSSTFHEVVVDGVKQVVWRPAAADTACD
jgi:hypothetical protein